MYENYSPYIRSEIDYRRERIQSGTGSQKSRRPRITRGHRSAVTSDNAR